MALSREIQHFGPYGRPSSQDIYQQSATKLFPLGTRYDRGDGRVFRYAQAGAVALLGGNLLEQAVYGGADTEIQETEAVATAGAVGDQVLGVTAVTTAQAANLFEDGWLAIWDATTAGMSYMYSIKSHGAISATVSSDLTLYDPLHIAITVSDQTFLIVNPYKALVASAATAIGGAVGVAPISVTASYYFWCQTYGPAAVFPEGALLSNEDVCRSDLTAGAVCKRASSLEGQTVGYCLHVGTTNEASIVFLTLAW